MPDRLIDIIAEKTCLKTEITATHQRIQDASDEASRLRVESDRYGANFRERVEQHVRDRDLTYDERLKVALDQSKDIREDKLATDSKAADAAAAEQALAELHERIRAAQGRLAELGGSATLDDLLEHQQALTDARAVVETITAKLAEVDAQIGAARQTQDPLAGLEDEHAALLAAVALGEAGEATLEPVRGRIGEAAEAQAAGLSRSEDALSTLVLSRRGLLRRLEAAKAEVARLEGMTKPILAFYLRSEQEAAAKRLGKAYKDIVAWYERFVADEGLRRSLDPDAQPFIARWGGAPLVLPKFPTEAMAALPTLPNLPGIAYTSERLDPAALKAAELTRLRELGITLLD